VSCPFCKRTDTDGFLCDDDHCREDLYPYREAQASRKHHDKAKVEAARADTSDPVPPMNHSDTVSAGVVSVPAGVQVILTCKFCARQHVDHPTFRLTRLGGTRLHLRDPHWYVDGGVVACPDCRSPEMEREMHSETWEDMLIRQVCGELGIEAHKETRTHEEWVVTVR
jgi:hypothetical protein